ncbi:hypothetical protein TRFO_42666 [Tritrichomonas foetus]|uniref:Uncharacterized protein n=1 Tax=Tritrichomonas foetus TaxID=1144522 RepID=A0A1J4KV66_9EUKA|nr:hypothetical protein TRFO_42666 [Tritrichomonas foetus]|eukprot:OHT15209.1 hypothetical protein TRFO_42666 [Tritrichomonas foetus]
MNKTAVITIFVSHQLRLIFKSMQINGDYENLKNLARYIDAGTKTISDCIVNRNYDSLVSNEDDKLISDINEGINIFTKETEEISTQISRLDNLNSLLSRAQNEISELKRYGAILGLQFATTDFAQQDTNNANTSFNGENRNKINQNDNFVAMQTNTPLYHSSDPVYRPIAEDEYQTLPAIVPLLVRLDDMNKHYQHLMNTGALRFTSEQFAEIVQLSSSRINAFVRALVQLNRMAIIEERGSTSYQML